MKMMAYTLKIQYNILNYNSLVDKKVATHFSNIKTEPSAGVR